MKKTNTFVNLTKADVRKLNRKSLANTKNITFDPSEADIEMARVHLAKLFNCSIYKPYALKLLYLNELY